VSHRSAKLFFLSPAIETFLFFEIFSQHTRTVSWSRVKPLRWFKSMLDCAELVFEPNREMFVGKSVTRGCDRAQSRQQKCKVLLRESTRSEWAQFEGMDAGRTGILSKWWNAMAHARSVLRISGTSRRFYKWTAQLSQSTVLPRLYCQDAAESDAMPSRWAGWVWLRMCPVRGEEDCRRARWQSPLSDLKLSGSHGPSGSGPCGATQTQRSLRVEAPTVGGSRAGTHRNRARTPWRQHNGKLPVTFDDFICART